MHKSTKKKLKKFFSQLKNQKKISLWIIGSHVLSKLGNNGQANKYILVTRASPGR